MLAICDGHTLSNHSGAGMPGFARTPTQPGAINPAAIPLGDGYVAAKPRLGYVDSCMTTFGGQGGAQAVGPWINTSAKTWNYVAKVAVSGSVSWPHASYRVPK